jgi:DNA-binding protein H-NS
MECRKNPKVEQKTRGTERRPTKKVQDLSSMSVDELWALHQKIAVTLVAKITAEKEVIEDRLRLLNHVRSHGNGNNPAG